MSSTNTYFPQWKVSDLNAEFTPKASLAVGIGDLMHWVAADTAPEPASALADLGTAALMQAAFARLFMGVANSARLATDTTTTTALRILLDGIWEFTCESDTFAIGDYVGASYNVNVLRDQTVAKVSNEHLAIGRVVKRYASATTKVKVRLMSRYLLGVNRRFADIGGCGQGLARTATTATGNVTLTVGSNPSQLVDPNGSDRSVTLPAVAQSNGLVFYIQNSGTANVLNVKNPAATTIATIGQGQAAIAWCDDTGWVAIAGFSGADFGNATFDQITMNEAGNIAVGTTTGTQIGTGATQKLALFGATPIVQPANTVDYLAGLVNLGLRAAGGTAAAAFPGSVTSSAPTGGGIGYATGAGGAVTQATNRTTGVTLNKLTGTITTNNASLAAEAAAKFTVTNSTVAIGDTVIVSQQSGSNGGNTDVAVVAVAAGSFDILVANNNAAAGTAETGAILINFAVIKAVSA